MPRIYVFDEEGETLPGKKKDFRQTCIPKRECPIDHKNLTPGTICLGCSMTIPNQKTDGRER